MTEGFAGYVRINVKPEMLEQFKELAIEVGDAMSKEPEFEHAWVHTVAGDPHAFFVYEAWSCSLEYFYEELRNKPYRHRFEAALESMTTAEREIVILDNFAAYPG